MSEQQAQKPGNPANQRKISRLVEAKYSANVEKPNTVVPGYSKRSQFFYSHTPWLAMLLIMGVSLGLFFWVPLASESAKKSADDQSLSSVASEIPDFEDPSVTVSATSSRLFQPVTDLRNEMNQPETGWGLFPSSGISRLIGEVSFRGKEVPVSLFLSGANILLRMGEKDDFLFLGKDEGRPICWRQNKEGDLLVEDVNLFELGLIEAVVRRYCPLKEAVVNDHIRILRIDRESLENFGKSTVHFQVSDGVEDVDLSGENQWTTRWRKRSFPEGELMVSYSAISEVGNGVFPHKIGIRWGSGEEAVVSFRSVDKVESIGSRSLLALVKATADIPSIAIR